MNNLKDKRIVVYDLETTGFSPSNDDVIEFSWVVARWDGKIFKIESYEEHFIKTNKSLQQLKWASRALAVSGKNPDVFYNDLKNNPEKYKDLGTITKRFLKLANQKDVLVSGYNNSTFDDKFIRNFDPNFKSDFDIFKQVKTIFKGRVDSFKKDNIHQYIFGSSDLIHSSLQDSVQTLNIFNHMLVNENLKFSVKKPEISRQR